MKGLPRFDSPAVGLCLLTDAIARVARFALAPERVVDFCARQGVRLTTAECGEHFVELERIVEWDATCRTGCPVASCAETVPVVRRDARGALYFSTVRCPKAQHRRLGRRVDRSLTLTRVPVGLQDRTLASFRIDSDVQRDAARAVRATLESTQRGLTLAGPTGVGKTHLVAAFANHRLAAGREVAFCKVPDLFAALRAGVRSDQTERLVELLREVELLVLDDLGAERPTDFSTEQLYRIVDTRLLSQKQTVVTTNFLAPGGLAERLGAMHGARIVSRLREAGTWLQMPGADLRLVPQNGSLL